MAYTSNMATFAIVYRQNDVAVTHCDFICRLFNSFDNGNKD